MGPGEVGLQMQLNANPSATGRPDKVLNALDYQATDYLVQRTWLILSDE